ncbi:J domain-containing protein [Pyxidicoccus parkwayensis]|uniref:J domain-containing protein n=1 Tax=Pyxidicoccus parkwayensis TaxID=2813578 RepID=A0ABX7NTK8_9BACT|nr:J domain-containing protein [Pyxidicoccus parkwaysis]QSQ19478.1 J domain-containing protein [Pyxidicoccus parkwaysis]
MSASDALVVRPGALARTQSESDEAVAEAERRLHALLEEISMLDLEVETLASEMASFSALYERELAAAFAQLERRERLVRRLQALQDELARLDAELRAPPPPEASGRKKKRKKSVRSHRTAWEDEAEGERPWTPGATLDDDVPEPLSPPPDLVSEEQNLKRLYRKLARLIHPDLARTEEERQRLHQLMIQVNLAFEKGDRTSLELFLARVDKGELTDTSLSVDERLAHVEKRSAALTQIRRSLLTDLDRLRGTSTFRLHAEWKGREELGRDYFQETLTELAEDAERTMRDALARMGRLDRAARELTTLKNSLTEAKSEGALRTFDPVLESPLVRKGAERLERQRASSDARALAQTLEEAVEQAPWEAALVLLAFFAERAGRPPDALASREGWAERYAALATAWPEAPSFEELLTRLPPPLELGLRYQGGKVRFGLQLKSVELLAGVPIALERRTVATLAQRVLAHLGPREACKGCGADVFLVHLMRTRGLDELNGLVCPACGHVAKSYFLFNWSEGQEALLPYSLKVGLVDEVVVKLAGKGIAFQLVSVSREALTVGALKQLFTDLYLKPYGIEAQHADLLVKAGSRVLKDEAPVEASVLTLGIRKADRGSLASELAEGEQELVALLRSRIERRFRPG